MLVKLRRGFIAISIFLIGLLLKILLFLLVGKLWACIEWCRIIGGVFREEKLWIIAILKKYIKHTSVIFSLQANSENTKCHILIHKISI